jgi:hypothetical protein
MIAKDKILRGLFINLDIVFYGNKYKRNTKELNNWQRKLYSLGQNAVTFDNICFKQEI